MVSSKIETLWIQLGPDTSAGTSGTDALLNGLDIFKLAQRRDLSYPSKPSFGEKKSSAKKQSTGWPFFTIGNGTTSAQGSKFPVGTLNFTRSMTNNRVGKHFALAEFRLATNNFDDSLVIGVGGFGKFYKGEIDDGSLVAVKRAHPQSQQGLREFETEIEMLSKLD
ncbi:hypothetical protein IFM89_025824 [Coptis chinensis]|uniref:Protein kinase domain-containing protein n=1 Tax=Coptis chinensis TaxID=261450 RepID=A0A835LGI5_9MAGN|nr:hypothetical protein IFM89_025824 [Coptis chinensis]